VRVGHAAKRQQRGYDEVPLIDAGLAIATLR
jgi:hypothetical protein